MWEAGACKDVKADLRPRLAARRAEAGRRLAQLRAFAGGLDAALRHLDALPDRGERCDPECGFLKPRPGADAAATAGEPVPVSLSPRRRTTAGDDDAPLRQGASEDGRQREPMTARWRTAPVACSLDGERMDERLAQRHHLLDGAIRTEIADGLRLPLPVERTTALAALAATEHVCCAFLDFRLHLDAPHVRLEVRAPAHGAALLTALVAPSGRPAPTGTLCP